MCSMPKFDAHVRFSEANLLLAIGYSFCCLILICWKGDQPIARTEMICEVLECCAALAQSALASLSTEQLDKPKRDWLFLLGVLGTISLLAANLAKIKPTQRQRTLVNDTHCHLAMICDSDIIFDRRCT